jgi:indole-3-glycerol phosphate synthase
MPGMPLAAGVADGAVLAAADAGVVAACWSLAPGSAITSPACANAADAIARQTNATMQTPDHGNPDQPAHGGHESLTGSAAGLTMLDRIVARKRVEVAKAKINTPLSTLQLRCAQLEPPRNFFAAVVDHAPVRTRTRVIAEVKRKSPSAGVLREDFNPVDIATRYAKAGASALSVLTDEEFFGGHLGYIQQVREAVDLPVLRKDFIVDEYQVWESRAANADAVLLIAEVIPEGELLDMMILARELHMTTLVEAHDVENLLKVRRHIGFPHAGYSLLGINNRDLRTMQTDLSHTIRMAEMVEDKRVLVSESGIKTADDLKKLRQNGVHIVLVGESLLREKDPGAALRKMLGR